VGGQNNILRGHSSTPHPPDAATISSAGPPASARPILALTPPAIFRGSVDRVISTDYPRCPFTGKPVRHAGPDVRAQRLYAPHVPGS